MSSDGTNLSLLLDSLLSMHRYHACLQDAVLAAMELLRNYQFGNELWVAALRNVFQVVWKCLGCPAGREEVRGRADKRLLRRLGVCLLKAVDVTYDMLETDCPLSLPVGLLWTMLYTLIARSVGCCQGCGLLLRGMVGYLILTLFKNNTSTLGHMRVKGHI